MNQSREPDPSAVSPVPAVRLPPETSSSQFRTTQFGPTVFEAASSLPRAAGLVFDVCHIGVVLRALLFAHGIVAIGALFASRGASQWLMATATGAVVALPGVLMWLLLACLCKRPLDRLRPLWQWAAAMTLGAVSGLMGWGLGAFTGLELFDAIQWTAPMAAGAAMAAVMFQWLRLRAQASLPADTRARLSELQSRIRPHFLFNTLNTALSLVRLDPARAEKVLEDLAELFRVALTDSGAVATLADEVELARRYLAIEQIRFGERLTVTWDLDEDAAGAKMPPLLLQPLVENAVRHGVEPADQGGAIRIRTRVRRGRAVLSIANSVPAQPSRPGNGIALRNVRERLRLMHDVASEFEVRRDGGVFHVQLTIPL